MYASRMRQALSQTSASMKSVLLYTYIRIYIAHLSFSLRSRTTCLRAADGAVAKPPRRDFPHRAPGGLMRACSLARSTPVSGRACAPKSSLILTAFLWRVFFSRAKRERERTRGVPYGPGEREEWTKDRLPRATPRHWSCYGRDCCRF